MKKAADKPYSALTDNLSTDECKIISDEEKRKILYDFNNIDVEYGKDKTIQELFENQVEKTPNNIALVFKDKQMTYKELNEKANSLARVLRKSGVDKEKIVGILVQKSTKMIIAMLGVLKAGGAYLPIDPDYPIDRIEYMLQDSGASVLLTQGKKYEIKGYNGETIDLQSSNLFEENKENLPIASKATNLAYIIYTSGTTGKPKGVMISHLGVSNLKVLFKNEMQICEGDRILQFASFSFDASVWEITMALLNGAQLNIPQKETTMNYIKFQDYLNSNKITVATLPPAYLNSLDSTEVKTLRLLITAGSSIDKKLLNKWSNKVKYINAYGPTEVTICSSIWHYNDNVAKLDAVPIGKPINNLRTYIVDENNNLAPIGVEGEICVSGDSLARGYLNREEITKERFVEDPFRPGNTMYKTGDFGRWLKDGNIEYLGRIDSQVKIRGFRIELGEIQNLLNQCNEVKESVVLARQDSSRELKLVAYIVVNDDKCTKNEDMQKQQISEWKSSYTGKNIKNEEMQEWIKFTIDRILSLKPNSLLEIGCGSGMLIFGIADKFKKYHGTDISNKAIEYVRNVIGKKENIKDKVTLIRSSAEDFSKIKENDFDTVIINSVIQYFPNIHYLINVIKDSISKINGRGVIFLGDIRNYSLLKAFYTSISIYQLSNDTQIDLLKNRIVKSVLNEKELTINPMFFYALKQSLSQITHVEIRYKRGNSHNELTKFRYDAILHINSEIDPVIKDEVDTAIDWSSNRLSVDAINNILVEEKPKILKVKNVPNARLAEVLKQEKILANGKYFKNIGELNKAVNNELYNNGVEPEEFFKINNEDYITEVIWAGDGNDRYYNVIFMDKAMYTKENNYALPSWQDSNTLSCDWGKYCNNPVKGKLEKKLLLKIKSYLKSKLPAYMLPSSYIRVEKMPLTLNGKIDIKALSKIDDTNVMQQEYEAPRNETEKNLVNIWEKVLERKTIGINEDFFDLGGHSLKALIAISEMKMKLEIDIDVGDIFNNPTIKMLSKLVEKLDKKQYIKIKKAEEKKYYKASSAEKRIYTLWEINKNSVEYNIPMIVEIKEKMDKDKVEEVLNSLISRHEALRTSFEIIDGEILQKVLKQWKLDFKYKELYKKDIKKEIGDFIKPFSLAKAPLLRSELIKTEENNYIFLLDFHHIIFDGVSNVVIMDEFKRLYRGDKLGEVEFQYKDYSEWQNGLEEKEKVKDQEAYWVNRFKGEIPILNLITDYERPIIRKLEGNKISFTVSEKLTSKINYMARETGTTLYMVLLSALNILLSKYSSQEDIIVGTAEAGRAKAEFRNVVGMFVNTVALRNYPNGNKTYRKFLEEVKKNTINDLKNSEYQFEDLIGKLNIERDVSRNPLFDVMFTVENMSINNENDVIELKSNLVKFDLSLIVVEKEDTINFDLEYSTSLFKKETIERMINHYKNILKIITTNADIKISEIEVLTVEENNRILYQFNNTKEEYSKGKNINELFEEQVERTPNNIAVVFGNEQLTYKELNERANSLARVLKEKGVVRETIVGIMVEGSLEMIVGIMGILKVGGSYLPIDSEYPDNRIEYMLENSKANIILTQSKFIGRINHGCEIINLENNLLYERDKSNLKIVSRPENLAYVIYTSGSTGKPKGVMVENKSLVNLCFWHNTCFNVTQNDKVTKYAGFGFDASVWEILPYIIKGAAIFLIPNEIRLNVMKLNEFYNKNNITISFLPTQLCEQFMRLKNNSLRILLTGADKLNTYKKQSYKLVNNYGPTEGTVVTTSFVVTKQCNNIPIGKPISNVKCYIVNSNNQLVPIGVAGELCIGGESLARGYLNNEKSTVESFVDNPFYIGTKMYRTGDLARWLPDGNIEYLGRMDNQIKIRGYRIEVGEIERNLLDQKEIIEAVVTSRNDKNNNKYICAYVTTNSEITTKKLKEKLSKKLPIYMIPNYIIQLDKMPITQNGKVDQKVLASIDITQELETKYEAPRNKTEEILVKVWEDVLCIDHIGIDHNYYELGGDSIKSILIVSKLQKYGMSLEIKDIMQYPEIKQLSNHVKNNDL
uniref:non-ribosomal peptide synthetase n=1 Tax=Clostridium akagii TaxID=91623 RepID=UPI00047D5D9F